MPSNSPPPLLLLLCLKDQHWALSYRNLALGKSTQPGGQGVSGKHVRATTVWHAEDALPILQAAESCTLRTAPK